MSRTLHGLLPACLVAAAVFVACGPGVTSSATPSQSVGVTPTPSLTQSPAPSPTQGQDPSPSATPTPTVASRYPWLPAIDPSVPATLEIDTFVTATIRIVPVSGEPGAEPYRYDTGDPDPSTHPLMGFPSGLPLVVVHGPVIVDGVEWYLLTPAGLVIDIPTGWSPLMSPDGTRLLVPSSVSCPVSPISLAPLSTGALTDGLPACYGNTEVTIDGPLVCSDEPEEFVTGATWLQNGACRFDAPLTVYGLDPRLPAGRYRVTGHFDDPQAPRCRALGSDDAESRLQAVLQCRRAFVATSATPVPG